MDNRLVKLKDDLDRLRDQKFMLDVVDHWTPAESRQQREVQKQIVAKLEEIRDYEKSN